MTSKSQPLPVITLATASGSSRDRVGQLQTIKIDGLL
jgi:hypothetical protein